MFDPNEFSSNPAFCSANNLHCEQPCAKSSCEKENNAINNPSSLTFMSKIFVHKGSQD